MPALNAFVIMPFDPEFDAVYTDLIVPPLTAAGFQVQRADDVEDRQNVMVDVVRGIAGADLIVADLTTMNPNVFYELGLAHALGVPTVLIAQRDAADDIPFDLRQYRTEFYDTHFQRAKTIVETLDRMARSHAAGNLTFGSPVSDFLPGAAKPAVREQRPVGANRAHSPSVGEETPVTPSVTAGAPWESTHEAHHDTGVDDRGFLDFLEALDEGSDQLLAALSPISAATDDVAEKIVGLTSSMETVDPSAPGNQAKVKRLLLQTAETLNAYADEVEQRQPQLEEAVDNVTSSGLGYITLLAEAPKDYRDELSSTLATSIDLRTAVGEATEGLSEMRSSIRSLPPLTKQTNRARNRTVRALDSMLAQYERVRSYAEQSMSLAEDALEKAGPAAAEPSGHGPTEQGEAVDDQLEDAEADDDAASE